MQLFAGEVEHTDLRNSRLAAQFDEGLALLAKVKGPELSNSGPALRGRRWEGTHRLGCCLLSQYYQFKILLSSIMSNYFLTTGRGEPKKGLEAGNRHLGSVMWRKGGLKLHGEYWLLPPRRPLASHSKYTRYIHSFAMVPGGDSGRQITKDSLRPQLARCNLSIGRRCLGDGELR